MVQFLIIFAVLFIPLMAVIVIMQRTQARMNSRLYLGLQAKGWSEAPVSSFISPPFLVDYKSIVSSELHNSDAVVQIAENRMPFKIFLSSVSFSRPLNHSEASSHILLLDKKMGTPRNTDELSVTNVSEQNISEKYVVYVGAAQVIPL